MKKSQTLGRYTLYRDPLQLRDGHRLVALSGRQIAVLDLIVQAKGKPVAKEVFFEKIWQGHFVEEGNLTQTIFLLRRALGKLPGGAEYIQTVPGQGYSLAAGALPNTPQEHEWRASKDDTQAAPPIADAGFFASEDIFRTLVNSIEEYGIYMLDCGGRVMTWNLGAQSQKGFTASEVIGEHYSLFFLPDDIEAGAPNRELDTARRSGRAAGEGWRLRKNGERFWASFVLTAIREPGGKLVGFAKVVRDLSQRKREQDTLLRAEALLRRERDRLRAVAESSLDAIYICDTLRDPSGDIEDFVFTYLNSNVAKTVRIPREALLGGRMCDLFPVNRTRGLFDAYKRVVETGKPFLAELAVESEDVHSRWLRVHAVRLDEDGVAITASDVSDLHPEDEEERPQKRVQLTRGDGAAPPR